jgi:hypothetical protein
MLSRSYIMVTPPVKIEVGQAFREAQGIYSPLCCNKHSPIKVFLPTVQSRTI